MGYRKHYSSKRSFKRGKGRGRMLKNYGSSRGGYRM